MYIINLFLVFLLHKLKCWCSGVLTVCQSQTPRIIFGGWEGSVFYLWTGPRRPPLDWWSPPPHSSSRTYSHWSPSSESWSGAACISIIHSYKHSNNQDQGTQKETFIYLWFGIQISNPLNLFQYLAIMMWNLSFEEMGLERIDKNLPKSGAHKFQGSIC